MNLHYLTYSGRLSDSIGQHMGPSYNNEYFTVVSQTYDPNRDKTILGLALGILNLEEE